MKNQYNYLAILLLLLISSIPLLGMYYPQGHDWLYELVRASAYRDALIEGQTPPYWATNLYGGLGSPIFLYYAPLYAFLTAILYPITGQIDSAATLALITITAASLVFMYLFLRELFIYFNIPNDSAIRVGLYIFALSPYLSADKLLRNASAEFTALSISPLVLYGCFLIYRKNLIGAIVLASSIALTILAHNLTALIVFASSIAIVTLLYGNNNKRVFLYAIGGLALGLCLSAIFWLPALLNKTLMRAELLTTGKFDFSTQFKSITQYFGYDNFYSIGILVPTIVVFAFLCIYLLSKSSQKNINITPLTSALIFLLAYTLLLFDFSAHIWNAMPFMELFQFPWRMMGPISIAAATAGAVIFSYLCLFIKRQHQTRTELVVFLACILNLLPSFGMVNTLSFNLTERIPSLMSQENIRLRFLPATVRNEYLPVFADEKFLHDILKHINSDKSLPDKGAKEGLIQKNHSDTNLNKEISTYQNDIERVSEALISHNPISSVEGMAEIKNISSNGTNIEFEYSADTPGAFHFSRWFFSGWNINIDGIMTPPKSNRYGLLMVGFPPGRHIVKVQLNPPESRSYASLITYTAIIVLIALFLTTIARPYMKR